MSDTAVFAIWHGVPLAVAWLATMSSFIWPIQFRNRIPWTLRYYLTVGYVLIFVLLEPALVLVLGFSWWRDELVDHGLNYDEAEGKAFVRDKMLRDAALCVAYASIMLSPMIAYFLGHWWLKRRRARRVPEMKSATSSGLRRH